MEEEINHRYQASSFSVYTQHIGFVNCVLKIALWISEQNLKPTYWNYWDSISQPNFKIPKVNWSDRHSFIFWLLLQLFIKNLFEAMSLGPSRSKIWIFWRKVFSLHSSIQTHMSDKILMKERNVCEDEFL